MTRPARLVVAFGTATEIGKTWFGAATLAVLHERGVAVAARKPTQSFDPADPHPTDAEVLAAATGEAPEAVCPRHRWLGAALAPPMAADVLGVPAIRLTDLVKEVDMSWPASPAALGWVETVGGPCSPIADDGDGIDLALALGLDRAVLVADAALGTINAVRLAMAAIGTLAVPITVALNRFDATDDLHLRNLRWLLDTDGFDVVTSPAELAARLTP